MVLFKYYRLRRIERKIEYHFAKARALRDMTKTAEVQHSYYVDRIAEHIAKAKELTVRKNQLLA